MQLKTVINFDGEAYDFTEARFADLVAFERHFKVKASVLEPKPLLDEHGQHVLDDEGNEVMTVDASLEWIAFLFWRSLRRAGVIARDVSFDEDFIERIDGVDQAPADAKEADDADPSVPDQPTG